MITNLFEDLSVVTVEGTKVMDNGMYIYISDICSCNIDYLCAVNTDH